MYICVCIFESRSVRSIAYIHAFEFVVRSYVRTCTTYCVCFALLPYFFYNYPSCLNFFHLCACFVFVRTSMCMPIIYFAVFLPCISHFSASVIYETMRIRTRIHSFVGWLVRSLIRSYVVCFACLHTFQCI